MNHTTRTLIVALCATWAVAMTPTASALPGTGWPFGVSSENYR